MKVENGRCSHWDLPSKPARSCGARWTENSCRSGFRNQQLQRQNRTDGNILVVHQPFPGQWEFFQNRLRLGNIARIKEQDHAAAVAARVPFAHLAVQGELNGLPNSAWHYGHDLIARDSGLHRKEGDDAIGYRPWWLRGGWIGHEEGSCAWTLRT